MFFKTRLSFRLSSRIPSIQLTFIRFKAFISNYSLKAVVVLPIGSGFFGKNCTRSAMFHDKWTGP